MTIMTPLSFNEAELVGRIEQLPRGLRAAFGAACAQRLRTAYAAYCARTGRGDLRAIDAILLRLWSDLTASTMSDAEVAEQIEACMELIPREDDGPWVTEQAAAEDAASALAYSLRCRLSGHAQEAGWAARCVYDAIDHYVINHEGIDTNVAGAEARILASPLVQAEFARQSRDIDELLGRDVSIMELRERSMREPALGEL